MNYVIQNQVPRKAAGVQHGFGGLFFSAHATLNMWYDRQRQRRRLAGLDDRLLRDIGIERADALREASKPFWQE